MGTPVPLRTLNNRFKNTMYYRTINEGLGWRVEDCEALIANADENCMKEIERFMNREGVTSIRWIKPEGVGALTDEIRDRKLNCADVLCDILNCTGRGVYYRRLLGEQVKDSAGHVTRGLADEMYAAILNYIKWNTFMSEGRAQRSISYGMCNVLQNEFDKQVRQKKIKFDSEEEESEAAFDFIQQYIEGNDNPQVHAPLSRISESANPGRWYEFKKGDGTGFMGTIYVPEQYDKSFEAQFNYMSDKQLYKAILAMGYQKWMIPFSGKGEANERERELMLSMIYNWLSTCVASKGMGGKAKPAAAPAGTANPNFKVYN